GAKSSTFCRALWTSPWLMCRRHLPERARPARSTRWHDRCVGDGAARLLRWTATIALHEIKGPLSGGTYAGAPKECSMSDSPSLFGDTLTFLFTDIEGSTQ